MVKGEAAELWFLGSSPCTNEQTHSGCIPLIRLNLDHGRKSVILLPLCVLVRGETRGAREKRIAFSVTTVPKKQQPTQM